MKKTYRLISTLFVFALLTLPAASGALESAEPRIVGMMFYADTCGSCKMLDPKIQAVKPEFLDQPILFATFDHSNDNTRNQAAMLAERLGLGDLYAAQKKASGYMLLVDAKTGHPVGKLTRDLSKQEIREALEKALASE